MHDRQIADEAHDIVAPVRNRIQHVPAASVTV
jgi:hypothetical protein